MLQSAILSPPPVWQEPLVTSIAGQDGQPPGEGSSVLEVPRNKPWSEWRDHLASRRRPLPIDGLTQSRVPVLLWGMHCQSLDRSIQRLVEWLSDPRDARRASSRVIRRRIAAWLAATSSCHAAGRGITALAWCRALPQLAEATSATAWWQLLESLVAIVRRWSQDPSPDGAREPLAHQLLSVELPMSLAYQLPEIAPCRALADEARQRFASALCARLDSDGLLESQYLPQLRALLASWTRCLAIARQSKPRRLKREAVRRYERCAQHALRLTRHDGAQVFTPAADHRPDIDLFRHLAPAKDDIHRALATRLFTGRAIGSSRRSPRRVAGGRATPPLPTPAFHSEAASIAILRSGWSPADPLLAVSYRDDPLQAELSLGRERLLSGAWELRVRADEGLLMAVSRWDSACWQSDADVDYLELELNLAEDVRVERHFLLARRDRFALVADAVISPRPRRFEYEMVLPLNAPTALVTSTETRDGFIVNGRRRALVIPLALPEWRVDHRPGMLAASGSKLVLSQVAEGTSLFAPLWIDLDSRRFARAYTWRPLTVAESRSPVRPDMAVGYRVQVGNRQWLIYRSLGPKGNRTVLGHNLVSEFLVGRFSRKGLVDPLLEIE